MATRYVNYQSDFAVEVTLLDAQGNVVAPPEWDWTLTFKVGTRKYECGQKDGELKSCRVVDKNVVCYLNNHRFGTGSLEAYFTQLIPDTNYDDGDRKTVTPQELNIELWSGASDTDGSFTAELNTGLVYADLYALAVKGGYTGTEAEYYGALSNPKGYIITANNSIDSMGENAILDVVDGEKVLADYNNGIYPQWVKFDSLICTVVTVKTTYFKVVAIADEYKVTIEYNEPSNEFLATKVKWT